MKFGFQAIFLDIFCVPVTKSNFPVFYERLRSEVKSEGAENKIGHSIFPPPALPPPPINNSNKRRPLSVFKTPTTFQLDPSDAILNGAENKKLHRITFHRGVGRVGGGSADQCGKKNEKSQSIRLRTLFLVLNRRIDVYNNVFKS